MHTCTYMCVKKLNITCITISFFGFNQLSILKQITVISIFHWLAYVQYISILHYFIIICNFLTLFILYIHSSCRYPHAVEILKKFVKRLQNVILFTDVFLIINLRTWSDIRQGVNNSLVYTLILWFYETWG